MALSLVLHEGEDISLLTEGRRTPTVEYSTTLSISLFLSGRF